MDTQVTYKLWIEDITCNIIENLLNIELVTIVVVTKHRILFERITKNIYGYSVFHKDLLCLLFDDADCFYDNTCLHKNIQYCQTPTKSLVKRLRVEFVFTLSQLQPHQKRSLAGNLGGWFSLCNLCFSQTRWNIMAPPPQ